MNDQLVTQTVIHAAVKTFLQAFLAVLMLLLVPILTNWATTIGNGGDIEVDLNLIGKIAIAAVGGGIAALISFVQNQVKAIPS